MNRVLVTLASMCLSTNALAQACWNEWEYKQQMLISAGQCSENVSIQDFERGYCKARSKRELQRSASKCPTTVKTKEGADIVTQSIVARCLGVKPPGANGQANTYYYGGSSFTDSKQSLRELCTGFEGKWVDGAK